MATVGVRDLDFWDFPDSNIRNSPELRTKIAGTLAELKPDVALTIKRFGVSKATAVQPAPASAVRHRRADITRTKPTGSPVDRDDQPTVARVTDRG